MQRQQNMLTYTNHVSVLSVSQIVNESNFSTIFCHDCMMYDPQMRLGKAISVLIIPGEHMRFSDLNHTYQAHLSFVPFLVR